MVMVAVKFQNTRNTVGDSTFRNKNFFTLIQNEIIFLVKLDIIPHIL